MNLKERVEDAYQKCLHLKEGVVTGYIPELAKAKSEDFAISVVTTDGQLTQVGNVDTSFSIQSISKPFSYAKCLELYDFGQVFKWVGVEPTGEEFNSISRLSKMKKPMNPMVNTGAIVISSLLVKKFQDKALPNLLTYFSELAGRPLTIDNDIFKSEWNTMDLNRSLAYLLKHNDGLAAGVEKSLELYTQLCSVSLNSTDLAVMGATLANQGINPLTKKQCVPTENLKSILSLMLTCGMYNYSGQWVFDIGLPAKSGVSGGVLMIIPNTMAIAIYSPRVDESGNSVRGIAACRELSKQMCLHLLDPICII